MPGDDRSLPGDEGERAAVDLGLFWDEVVERAPANPLPKPDLDASLTTTIRRLHAADDAPGADAAFAKRLIEDLMHAHATTATLGNLSTELLGPATAPADGGRLIRPRRWWHVVELAAMAAVILVLVGGVYLYDRNRSGLFGDDGGTPTASATSTSPGEATPSESSVMIGGTVQLPPFGLGPTDLILRRLTFEAGATLTMPASGMAYALVPESGTFAVPDATVESGWRIDPGFPGIVGSGTGALQVRNAGTGPATALLILIGPDAQFIQAPAGIASEELGGGFAGPLVDSVVYVRLERRVLAAGERSDETTGEDGVTLFAVESGSLRMNQHEGELNYRPRQADGSLLSAEEALNSPIPIGQAVTLAAGDAALLHVDTDFTLANDGAVPASVLVVLVDQDPSDPSVIEIDEETPVPTEGGDRPEGAPTAVPIDPSLVPEGCHATPMSLESLDELLNTRVPAATVKRIMSKPIYRDGEGQPADAATIASLEETLREMAVCLSTGRVEYYLPFLSQDYIMMSMSPGGEWSSEMGDGTVPPVPEAFDVRIQSDGRITARIDFRDGGSPPLITFVRGEERWQIDYNSEG
jgi:hypothetical protein